MADQNATEIKSTRIVEGSATVTFPGIAAVFYNPVQQFNRDLSICVLKEFVSSQEITTGPSQSKKSKLSGNERGEGVTVLEALAASGLR